MKLKCTARAGRPVIIEEMGHKFCKRGDIIDGKDPTYAAEIMRKYPGCFEPAEEAKEVKKQKDKMLASPQLDKDFV